MEESYFKGCLYFEANKFKRMMNELANKAFEDIQLSPSHCYILMLLNDKGVLSPKQVSFDLDLKPSTITRLVQKLEDESYIKRNIGSKKSICLTSKGIDIIEPIKKGFDNLHLEYKKLLGKELEKNLTTNLIKANKKIKEKI